VTGFPIADDREAVSGVPDLLAQMPEVELRYRTAGCRRLPGRGIRSHRKKDRLGLRPVACHGTPFRASGANGEVRARPAYILEGHPGDWTALGVRREALQRALITLMVILDIPVLRAADASETARLILYAGQQLARLRDPNHAPYRQIKAKRNRFRQLRLLQTLPAVGTERARRLLDHFGSIRACFEARTDELHKIDGIGPRTAQAILDTIQEASPSYSSRNPLGGSACI
jgi:DNA excision repair protein ERCC-4